MLLDEALRDVIAAFLDVGVGDQFRSDVFAVGGRGLHDGDLSGGGADVGDYVLVGEFFEILHSGGNMCDHNCIWSWNGVVEGSSGNLVNCLLEGVKLGESPAGRMDQSNVHFLFLPNHIFDDMVH